MQSAELINRYVNAVGENLPKKSRADIQAELRSLLSEMLDVRSEAEGRPVDQAMTVAVLREFGEPAVVAQRYAPSRPLIGPAYYPIFVLVIKIVAAVMTVLWAVGAAIAVANSDGSLQAWSALLFTGLTGLIGQMLANFGLIVIIFAVMERVWAKPPSTGQEPWDPLKLPIFTNPNQVDRSDVILSIVGGVVILIFFNLRPNVLPLFLYPAGGWQLDSIFGPALYRYLPWINLFCVSEIVLYSYVLYRSTWTRPTRVLEIGLDLFAAAILAAMLTDSGALIVIPFLDPLIKISLAVALVIVLVNVAVNLYRLVTKRWNPPGASELELASNGQHS